MKDLSIPCLSFLLICSAHETSVQAAWQTVDSPDRVEYLAIAADAAGHIFAVGDYVPVSGPWQAILRRSLDGGQTWQTVAMPPTPPQSFSQFVKVTVDPAGQVYALRYIGSNFELWRSSGLDAGLNLVQITSFDSAYVRIADLACDAAGNVYVCGYTAGQPWRTLKGTPTAGGIDWSVIDDYVGDSLNPINRPKVIATRPSGNAANPAEIWVGGVASNSIVFRRSVDAGATWMTVAAYEDNDAGSGLSALAISRSGVAYAAGRVRKPVGYGWLTRQSTNNGATWNVVDDVGTNYGGRSVAVASYGRVYTTALRWAAGGGALVRTSPAGAPGTWQDTDSFGFAQSGDATGVSVDAFGNVYVCGYMEDASVGFKGIIRKLTAPAGPKLSATLSGAQLKLSWPASATGFVMQAKQSVNGSDWQDLLMTPATNGGQQAITIETAAPEKFFRLLRP